MSLYNIFDISSSAMQAQSLRLTTTASNMSNSKIVSGTEEGAYKARQPIFAAIQAQANNNLNAQSAGVKVLGVQESDDPAIKQYQPGHPLANSEGYVFLPNVNTVEEMTNMISASRSYQMNVEVLSTAKQLMTKTLQLGQ